ncbi:peptidoglycan-binding protein LysM [Pseudomonas cavernae]|uniref:Peptidoglycan-binding protein LysM n=1 Tax=Pseudomonas cavernae TaxID=2320867 RepID=A0A385Z418_9PSED|nr:FimV/HubP family polar landmark protein [Pseudomonas cavernae]AYC32242.1 peptidoglycan-binding protein LysM [Pseudomonas cavernae]
MASALGLGDISLHSALNQPLDAQIQLLEPGDLSSHEVIVRLASPDTYERLGVERFLFLNDLRFTPVLRGRGSVIRVVSSKPVREPYLNFIVEVVRPNGHLLREYTLLLDPPGSAAYNALAAPQPLPAPVAQAPRREPTPRPAPAAVQGKQYAVRAGDSLWSIARRVRAADSPLSLPELIQGIHALNPRAFVGGDSDRLIAGKTLLLPDAAMPHESAAAVVTPAEQNSEPAAASAPPPAPADTASLQQLSEAQRRLEQELANQATENLQLQQGIAELHLKLGSLEQQLSSKDQQVAELQAQLAQADRQAPAGSQVEAPASTAAAPAVAQQPAAPASKGFSLAWLGALLALLVGALLPLLLRRRQRAQPQPAEPMPQAPVTAEEPLLLEQIRPATPTLAVAPVRNPAAPTDAIEGADLYIAYGRYGAALSLLRKAAHKQPQRTEVQLRLLDVLGQMGDAAGFSRQLAVLAGLGVGTALIEPIQARYPQLESAAPGAELDDAVLLPDEPPAAAAQPAEAADEFPLNLDDLTLDADWDLVSPFASEQTPRGKSATERSVLLDADFHSNLDELPEVQELTMDADSLSPFGEPLLIDAVPSDETLDEEFLDVFADPELNQAQAPSGDLEHLAGDQSNMAKLDLALAYIDQGDMDSACDILNEVISDGNLLQKQEARALLARIA